MSYALFGPSFIDITQNIWLWGVRDIIDYIRRQCEAAEVDLLRNPTARELYIVQVYRNIIIPAIERKAPFVTERQIIKHVYVVENTGPVICITDFYTAFGYVITMTELAAHTQHEESFYVELVLRFAVLCYVMHHHYFKPNMGLGNEEGSPAKVHILWGPMVSSSSRFTSDSVAQKLRKSILERELLGGVKLPCLQNVGDFGYCAETLPFISRLSVNGAELKGLSVDIPKIGKLALYGPLIVSSNELCTPACLNCQRICNIVGHSVYDLANGQRYGQRSASSRVHGSVTSDDNSSATGSSESRSYDNLYGRGLSYGQGSLYAYKFWQPPSLGLPSPYQVPMCGWASGYMQAPLHGYAPWQSSTPNPPSSYLYGQQSPLYWLPLQYPSL
ncbi:hypothetical protein A0H81_09143 [Grifola frondosa]|uniref:Uncharacterized protein n=1 Tax=Grifola frondosa TaxID=5627 RepID=A0A1C7M1W8_GRIFR|nr:hypothetical protein A0H81_09143 [Grifola frondosa]